MYFRSLNGSNGVKKLWRGGGEVRGLVLSLVYEMVIRVRHLRVNLTVG